MIALRSSVYLLPGTRSSVANWCAERGCDPALYSALSASGANHYFSADGRHLLDMGNEAVDKLFDSLAVAPDEIDVLILYQTSPCNVLPAPYSLAGALRQRCGLSSALAFSIVQQQCVSPVHAFRALDALMEKHEHWRHAILVGIDTILREDLRPIANSGFHSDGASALLVSRDGSSRIRCVETYNDPKATQGILADGSYEPNENYLWSLISVVRRVMKSAQLSSEQVTTVIPHNVNLPAWRQALDALRIPAERLFSDNFGRTGHIFGSDAAINIADSGVLSKPGNHLVFASGIGGCFGGFLLETGANSA